MLVARAAALTEIILNFSHFLLEKALTEGHKDDLLSCRYRLTIHNHPTISHRLLFPESGRNQFCAQGNFKDFCVQIPKYTET
jgi:hypothetical protein